jgi:hypothetical protein
MSPQPSLLVRCLVPQRATSQPPPLPQWKRGRPHRTNPTAIPSKAVSTVSTLRDLKLFQLTPLAEAKVTPPKSAAGGSITFSWLIEALGRKKATGQVAGHAQLIKMAGSVLNPAPCVVPVFAGDGAALGDQKGLKCIYYVPLDWEG